MSYELPIHQQGRLPNSRPPRSVPPGFQKQLSYDENGYEHVKYYESNYLKPKSGKNHQKTADFPVLLPISGPYGEVIWQQAPKLPVAASNWDIVTRRQNDKNLEILTIATDLDDSEPFEAPNVLNATIDLSRYCSPGYTWFETTRQCYKATVVPSSYPDARAQCQSENGHLTSIHSQTENVFISGLYHLTYHEYPDARAQCQSENGHLTSIHSQTESIFIAGLYHLAYREYNRRKVLRTKYAFWIGLGRRIANDTNSELVWDDGSELDFENWKTESDRRQAIVVAVGPTGILWFLPPMEVGGFVCKKDSENGTLEDEKGRLEQFQLDNGKCPFGYYYLSETNLCYLVSVKIAKYQEARETCKSTKSKGDLVSIHSELENILINGLIMMVVEEMGLDDGKATFWIGLEGEGQKLRWTDGSKMNMFDGNKPSSLSQWKSLFFWSYWKCWESSSPSDSMEMGYICKTRTVK